MVKRFIQYFCFPDRAIEGGNILDFWKGGNLRKGGVDLEKGGMNPLTMFYSGKETPLIPPLTINDQLITNFWEKANFFYLYFAKQCTPTENYIYNHWNKLFEWSTISAIDIEDKGILKIIWALQINKAHDHDNILTHMIKICYSTTVKTVNNIP